jgi:membrane protein implicated in regulation of membrane protease activity
MFRHLPTPLGIGLIAAGLSLIISPRVAVLLFAGSGVALALVIAVAVARGKRSGRATGKTASEELSDWREFAARRRRSAPLESAVYVLIALALILLEGLTLGTILIAAGFGCLLIARWLVEPRTWAEITRRLAAPRT